MTGDIDFHMYISIISDGRNILQDSQWSLNQLGEKVKLCDLDTCSSDTPRKDSHLMKVMAATDFTQIQYLILTVLKVYALFENKKDFHPF